jgi:RNA polymerase sigma-70 factor, ECF subfamily
MVEYDPLNKNKISSEVPAGSHLDKAQEFETLSMTYLDALYRYALSLTRNKNDAEDLVQEAYLRAYRSFNTFQRGTNLKAWLFKILTNTFFTLYQKQKRYQAAEEKLKEEPDFSLFRDTEKEIASVPSVVRAFPILTRDNLENLLGDEVTKALDELPDEYRQALILCDVQDFTYQEIANILDVPIGTVRSRLFRARSMLQKSLWHYAEERGLWRRAS